MSTRVCLEQAVHSGLAWLIRSLPPARLLQVLNVRDMFEQVGKGGGAEVAGAKVQNFTRKKSAAVLAAEEIATAKENSKVNDWKKTDENDLATKFKSTEGTCASAAACGARAAGHSLLCGGGGGTVGTAMAVSTRVRVRVCKWGESQLNLGMGNAHASACKCKGLGSGVALAKPSFCAATAHSGLAPSCKPAQMPSVVGDMPRRWAKEGGSCGSCTSSSPPPPSRTSPIHRLQFPPALLRAPCPRKLEACIRGPVRACVR